MSVTEAPKRAYRYQIVETGGAGERAVGDSPYILDWKYLGKEYTWNIVGGPKDGFKSKGFIHGRFVDKGYCTEGGQYESDKERLSSDPDCDGVVPWGEAG